MSLIALLLWFIVQATLPELLSTKFIAHGIWEIIDRHSKREGDPGSAIRTFLEDLSRGEFGDGVKKQDVITDYLLFAIDVINVYIYVALVLSAIAIYVSGTFLKGFVWVTLPIGFVVWAVWTWLVFVKRSSSLVDIYRGTWGRRLLKIVLLLVLVAISIFSEIN